MTSKTDVYIHGLVTDYAATNKRIAEIEDTLLQRFLTIEEHMEYTGLKEKRTNLINAMGVEMPDVWHRFTRLKVS